MGDDFTAEPGPEPTGAVNGSPQVNGNGNGNVARATARQVDPVGSRRSARSLPAGVASVLLLGMPTVLAFFSGGYGVRTQLLAAAVAFAALALLCLSAPWPLIQGRSAAVALAGLAGLAAWTWLSVRWAPVRNSAAQDTARLGLYAAVFAGGAIALRGATVRRAAPVVLLGGASVVALYALAGRLLPQLVPSAGGGRAESRLDQPLTYWNAMGILCAIGVLLAVATAADEDRPRAGRAAACALAVPCALAQYMTFSRGALVALAAGLVVLVLVGPGPRIALSAGLGIGTAAILAVVLEAFPAVLDLGGSRADQQSQGLVVALLLVAGMTAAALAHDRLSGRQRRSVSTLGPRLRRTLVTTGVLALLAVGGLMAASTERTELQRDSAGRLRSLSTDRFAYWDVALGSFAAHPLAGVGSGGFASEWRRERSSPEFLRDAHSLYVETLAELGLVGFGLLLAFMAAVLAGLRRGRREAPGDPFLVAAAAVLCAVAVHAGLDWDWEMPTVALPALLLAAGVTARPAAPRPSPPEGAVAEPGFVLSTADVGPPVAGPR